MDRKNNPLVSVIVPCYNTQVTFFKSCIESIKKQSYKNIELIVIDDGSDNDYKNIYDNCLKEVRPFFTKASIYHIKNSGVSFARNYGIEKSTGDFICFVDSDDYIHMRFIEILADAAIRYGVPVSSCLLLEVSQNMKFFQFPVVDKIEYNEYKGYEVWKNVNMGYVTGKLFRKEFMKDIRFKVGMSLCEDTLFVNQFMEKNPYAVCVFLQMYICRKNLFSVTMALTAKQYEQAIYASNYYKNVSYIKNNEELYINAIRIQSKWIIKYLAALVKEKEKGWKIKYKKTRKLFLKETYPYIDKSKGINIYIISKVLRAGMPFSIFYFDVYNIIKKYYRFFQLKFYYKTN